MPFAATVSCRMLQVVALCQALQGERINSLTLDYNLLGNTAAKAVAQLLQARYEAEDADAASRKHRGLVELHLRSNHITAEGATVLADALSHPGCTLQVSNHCSTLDVVRLVRHCRWKGVSAVTERCEAGTGR